MLPVLPALFSASASLQTCPFTALMISLHQCIWSLLPIHTIVGVFTLRHKTAITRDVAPQIEILRQYTNGHAVPPTSKQSCHRHPPRAPSSSFEKKIEVERASGAYTRPQIHIG
jgi:hypothetical protein